MKGTSLWNLQGFFYLIPKPIPSIMSWEWAWGWHFLSYRAIIDCLPYRFNFLDYNEYTGDSDNDDGDINDPQQSEEPPSDGLPPPLLDSSSHETSPLHSPSSSNKQLNVPQIEIIAGHGKGKGRSPLLQSHRTGSESHLAIQPQSLHLDTTMGQRMNRAMSSSHSGNLSLTNGLLAKEDQQRGHSRSKSSGSSSGDSDSGIGKSRGPLSSSSLPPDSLRRLVQSMKGMGHERKGSGGQLTVSYHEAA